MLLRFILLRHKLEALLSVPSFRGGATASNPESRDFGLSPDGLPRNDGVRLTALHAEEQRRSRREAAEDRSISQQTAIFAERNRGHIDKGLTLDLGADRR